MTVVPVDYRQGADREPAVRCYLCGSVTALTLSRGKFVCRRECPPPPPDDLEPPDEPEER